MLVQGRSLRVERLQALILAAPCRLHVDAAYAGPLAMLPEMRQHFMGLELVEVGQCSMHSIGD